MLKFSKDYLQPQLDELKENINTIKTVVCEGNGTRPLTERMNAIEKKLQEIEEVEVVECVKRSKRWTQFSIRLLAFVLGGALAALAGECLLRWFLGCAGPF